ncbi:hypothetical protein HHK36_019541 [Tetracentron sinense]|uniref:C2H2-type domain-containing protein n=1 Tax=Tetracentron sinense TaxID=13715 RepID=A0A834YZC9_TETSI|nr:hypothetical protein HHK36_019541 [Tetracentron sinense]
MAEVMNMPVESSQSLDRRRDRQSDRKEKSSEEPQSQPPPLPLPPRRRDRDSRERRDERDIDRPPNRRGGGDYYDRNRSPPQKDRDYKRRASPSPPYRDRRHSPPPFKRSRRDDGGYDGRRGSPRGGFGPDDRFGYDYVGGYERGIGGRPGYADERPRGRYMNRSSGGYQSGPSGIYSTVALDLLFVTRIVFAYRHGESVQRISLIRIRDKDIQTYGWGEIQSQLSQLWMIKTPNNIFDSILPADWDAGRGSYGDASNTGSMQREGLMSYKQFIQELEDDILPAEAERRRNEHARRIAKEFLLDLQSGTLDLGPGVNASSLNKSGQASDPNSDDEVDTGGKRRRHGRGPAKENDLLSAAPKAHPVCSEPRRIQADIEQAQALARKLDSEKLIGENVLCNVDNDKVDNEKSHGGSMGPIIIIRGLTSVKGLEGIELLDTLITYLWRIHGLDYYGMIETNEAKGLRHVRVDVKSYDETSTAGADWENKIDSFWQGRLRGQDPLEVMTAKEKIETAAVEALEPHVRKIRDEKYGWKYGCGAKGCTKLFHAAEFVHKHLRLKHPELAMELTLKVREDLYFQNYMNDTDAPGGTPVIQQPLSKDRPQRRRPGSDNRLRDDRGNRREHDRVDRVNEDERYDRSENSPSRDFKSNNASGPEGGNPDEPMYDTYGGQGMHSAPPFSSDIPPPPVLMPVPGAGYVDILFYIVMVTYLLFPSKLIRGNYCSPLGPFVPAPPEVAMRMLREQGGPSSYEGNSRKARSGPQIGGPGPILAVSPAFRQDPRRIRSYQDLDAPDDEVTVIDYRSL